MLRSRWNAKSREFLSLHLGFVRQGKGNNQNCWCVDEAAILRVHVQCGNVSSETRVITLQPTHLVACACCERRRGAAPRSSSSHRWVALLSNYCLLIVQSSECPTGLLRFQTKGSRRSRKVRKGLKGNAGYSVVSSDFVSVFAYLTLWFPVPGLCHLASRLLGYDSSQSRVLTITLQLVLFVQRWSCRKMCLLP